jgi:hypothetical protein
MTVQLLFGASVAFGFVAWAVVATLYIWPQLRTQSRKACGGGAVGPSSRAAGLRSSLEKCSGGVGCIKRI